MSCLLYLLFLFCLICPLLLLMFSSFSFSLVCQNRFLSKYVCLFSCHMSNIYYYLILNPGLPLVPCARPRFFPVPCPLPVPPRVLSSPNFSRSRFSSCLFLIRYIPLLLFDSRVSWVTPITCAVCSGLPNFSLFSHSDRFPFSILLLRLGFLVIPIGYCEMFFASPLSRFLFFDLQSAMFYVSLLSRVASSILANVLVST